MAEIFLSYRREDSAGYAGRLYDDLATQFGDGVVFRDVDTLPPGVDFDETIRTTISSCKALLVVIGRDWMTKRGGRRRIDDPHDYVRVEVETALRQGIPVIPVLVGRATMPSPMDLPASLRPLSMRNAIELDDSRWRFDLGRLVAALELSVSPRTPVLAAPDPPSEAPTVVLARPAPQARRRRKVVLAGAGTVTAVLAVAGLVVAVSGGRDGRRHVVLARTSETSLAPATTTTLPASPLDSPTTTAATAAPGPHHQQGPRPPATARPPDTSPPATSPPATSPPPTSPPPASPPATPPPATAPVVPAAPATVKVSPSSGAPGTVVSVGGAACVPPQGWTGGQVYYGINYWKTGEDVIVREQNLVPGSGWSDSVELPVKLYAGTYGVWANCFAWNAAAGTWSRFYDYVTVEFHVT